MPKPPVILIADRNPYVRQFLEREMVHAGYRVRLAENSRQLILWCHPPESPDLVIVDPDLPAADAGALLTELRRHAPDVPVLIHCHNPDDIAPLSDNLVWFVEKHGDSVEKIIRLARRLLGCKATV